MNRLPHRMLYVAAGLLLAAMLCLPPAEAAQPSAVIQRQIDALLKSRLRPEPLPVDPPNPFRVISGRAPDRAGDRAGSTFTVKPEDDARANRPALDPAGELAAASSAEVLTSCAAQLKIGGIMLKGQIHVVINNVPRREGDAITAHWNNSTVTLRVVRIEPGLVVLRLGDAEISRRF